MVIFFDIDGTVVDDDTQVIPESAIRAVSELKRRGHIPVVNTGRPYGNIDPRILAMDFSGWICACGMEILLDGRWLYRHRTDTQLCTWVRDQVRYHRMQVVYEDDLGLLVDGDFSQCRQDRVEVERMIEKGYQVRQIDSLPQPEFVKFVTHDSPEGRREAFVAAMEPFFTCINREDTMVEYVLKGCSKAKGMEAMLAHLGVSREETMAIGDSTNDLPMFSLAGHTVAMGNGMEELKAEAEFVTASVMEDGLEKAMKHFGLI